MVASVGSGPIVGVERFEILERCCPSQPLSKAREKMLCLLDRLTPKIVAGEPLPELPVTRNQRKTSRADFLRMCELPLAISREELDRRFRAFDGESYDILCLSVHGYRLRIEKQNQK